MTSNYFEKIKKPKPFKVMDDACKKKLGGRAVMASISGGKDSLAMALHLLENDVDCTWVFADTQWEDPQLYPYIEYLETVIGPIHRVGYIHTNEDGTTRLGGLEDIIRKEKFFPSGTRRFCTKMLKTLPIANFIEEWTLTHGECVNAVGIRALESRKRAKQSKWLFPGEQQLPKGMSHLKDLVVWNPIFDWDVIDVEAIRTYYHIRRNPLYDQGANRVGCHPCIFTNKQDIKRVARDDPDQIRRIERLEAELYLMRRERVMVTPSLASLKRRLATNCKIIVDFPPAIEDYSDPLDWMMSIVLWHDENGDVIRERDCLQRRIDKFEKGDGGQPLLGPLTVEQTPTYFSHWRPYHDGLPKNWSILEAVKWANTTWGGLTDDHTLVELGFKDEGCSQLGECSAYGLLFNAETHSDKGRRLQTTKNELVKLDDLIRKMKPVK